MRTPEQRIADHEARDHRERFPEHARLALIKDQAEAIGTFLDRMQRVPMKKGEPHIKLFGRWRWMSTQNILADYFGIDQQKLDKEKREMLFQLRTPNKDHSQAASVPE